MPRYPRVAADKLRQEAALIAKADELHAASDVDALFALLEGADTSDDEIAWRVARAHHDKAEDSAEVAGDAARREQLLRDGLAIAEAAKDASGSGYSLKWYAILLGRLGDFLPTKEKVGNSFKIKDGAYEGSGVRLMGFNTLESYGPVHRWGSWSTKDLYALAAASKNYAAGREWTCTTSGEKEGYGRLLIDCPDAAEALILVGHAHAFSMKGEAASELLRAQERAQRARRGMWAKGVPQSIVTSVHSSDEGKRGGYNRSVDSSSGESSVREHSQNYAVCEEVCEDGGSCLVYVPFAQRYRNKPDCLK